MASRHHGDAVREMARRDRGQAMKQTLINILVMIALAAYLIGFWVCAYYFWRAWR